MLRTSDVDIAIGSFFFIYLRKSISKWNILCTLCLARRTMAAVLKTIPTTLTDMQRGPSSQYFTWLQKRKRKYNVCETQPAFQYSPNVKERMLVSQVDVLH